MVPAGKFEGRGLTMSVDNIIHLVKDLGNIGDGDVTNFLRDRKFGSENSNLEFRATLPVDGGNSDARQICELIVGFLNAEGGVIIIGVSDRINDATVPFPEYVSGLTEPPNPGKLSQLARECISPPVDLPLRVFNVEGRKVAVLKVPPGDNKPYCYYDPRTHAVWYFVRSGNHIVELAPDEIRELYRASFAKQVDRFLRDTQANGDIWARRMAEWRNRVKAHQRWVKSKLEDPQNFGFVGMYTLPARPVSIPWNSLWEFVSKHRSDFTEEMRLFPNIDTYQNAVSVGYFPRAISADTKSTFRITLYQDGMVALDSQADEFMGEYTAKNLNPFWLAYQTQRHLQMTKALLEELVDAVHFIGDLENVQDFYMSTQDHALRGIGGLHYYVGSHQPIEREVAVREIYPHDGDKRNIVMPVVKDIMEEVSRIFGYSKAPHGLWDQNDYLMYVRGLENSR
jgi:hypothetical protein